MDLRTVEFWSSVQYVTFLRGLVRELNLIGWNAEQRYLIEEHEYRRSRGYHSTLRFRLRSYLQYPFQLYRRIQEPRRPAVLVVCTNTFYAPAVALLAARRRGLPVVNWVFDLYPDVLVQLGRLKSGGRMEGWLAEFTRYALRHAAVNVFLGDGVLHRAEERFGPIARTALIPVGADGAHFRFPLPGFACSRPISVLYCGNFGRMHELDTVSQFIRAGIPEPFVFSFRGKGVGMDRLRVDVADCPRVTFGPSMLEPEWLTTMRRTPIGLVTFKQDARGLGMPSKTYSAMVAGQAIVAICPRESDLAHTVLQYDAGWVIEPGHAGDVRALLEHLAKTPAEIEAKRRNAYAAGHAHFDQKVIALEWARLLDRIVGPHDLVGPSGRISAHAAVRHAWTTASEINVARVKG